MVFCNTIIRCRECFNYSIEYYLVNFLNEDSLCYFQIYLALLASGTYSTSSSSVRQLHNKRKVL